MRAEILNLIELGPLPAEGLADPERIRLHERLLEGISPPVTDDEARALVPPGAEFAYPGDLAGYGLVGTVDTVRERIAAYADAGVQELAISFEDPNSEEQVREFAKHFIA